MTTSIGSNVRACANRALLGRWLLTLVATAGVGACASVGNDAEPGFSGTGAAPGIAEATPNAAEMGEPGPGAVDTAAAEPTLDEAASNHDLAVARPTQEDGHLRLPAGVVLEDGRVISEEEASSGLAAKADGPITKRLTWSSSTTKLDVVSSTTHICGLTEIQGILSGNQAWVKKVNGSWQLQIYKTAPPTSGLDRNSVEATCYPLSAFTPTTADKMISDRFSVSFSGSGQRFVNSWWGDAATILTGIAGKFDGGGELARVWFTTTRDIASGVTLNSLQPGYHQADVHSLFVGKAGGTHTPQYIGPKGTGSLAQAGEFDFTFDGAVEFHAPMRLAKASDAFCYFSYVSGYWRNGYDWLQMSIDSSGFWSLQGSADDDNFVHAFARCYRLRQDNGYQL